MANDLTPAHRRDVTVYGATPSPPPLQAGDPRLQGTELHLQDIWALFWRNRWMILACLLLAVGAAVLYTRHATPIYQASALVRLEDSATRSISDNLRPERSIFGWGRSDELETEMEILRTHAFAESVVDSLGLQVVVRETRRYTRDEVLADVWASEAVRPGEYVLERTDDGFVLKDLEGRRLAASRPDGVIAHGGLRLMTTPSARRHAEIPLRVLSRQAATSRLLGGLSVLRVDPDVAIIRIRYESDDRDLAAKVPNEIAELFLVRRRTEHVTQASSTVQFLREQIDTLAHRLHTAEEELKAFQEREGVVALEAEGVTTIEQVAQMESARDAMQAETTSLGQLLREAESQRQDDPLALSAYRRIGAFPSLLQSPSTNTLLQSIIQLENERAELLTRRRPNDPEVAALTGQIQSMENQLHMLASTYYRGMSSQLGSIQASIGRERGQLSLIPRKGIEMLRRQREVELLQQVYSMLQTRLKESEIAEAVQDPAARIVDPAAVRGGPVRPRPMLNLMVAVILGLASGFGLALIRAWRDRTVHSKEEVRAITGAPILGLIPRFQKSQIQLGRLRRASSLPAAGNGASDGGDGHGRKMRGSYRLPASVDPQHAVAEAFRSLRTNITFTTAERQPRTLLVTSSIPGDGKTTSAINLVHAFAQQGLRALLVDADMRRGLIHDLFSIPRSPGLSNLLVERGDPSGAIRDIMSEEGTAFHVLPAGNIPPNPAELLASHEVVALLHRLVELYDIVVFDTPPLTLVTDAAVLSRHVDSVLLVVRVGHTEEAALAFAVEQLEHVNAPLRGTILNDIDPKDSSYGGYYHAYYGATN